MFVIANLMDIGEIDQNDSEEVAKNPSSKYINTNRAEDQIDVGVIKKTPSTFKMHHNESQDEKEDIEESNSLKPSTKEEPKSGKKNNKIVPENVKDKKKSFSKPKNYLTVSTTELRDEYNVTG